VGLFDKLKKAEVQKKVPSSLKSRIKEEPSEVELVPVEEEVLAKELVKPKVVYIKKIVISTHADLKRVSDELKSGNIVIVELTPLEQKPELLKKIAEQLMTTASIIGGDYAKICGSPLKVILTPPEIKIAKE